MELVKCPICEEMYSKSYKACPFCAESGPYEGTVKRRRVPGRRLERHRNPKILGPAMILVLLLLAAVLIYAFFGDRIRGKDPKNPEENHPAVVQLTVEPASVELAVGEIRALTASGGQGYVWNSSDEAVATVDEQGGVTAVAPGNAEIIVTDRDGEHTARCEVTVREGGTEPVVPEPVSNLALCTRWNGKELPTTYVKDIDATVYDMTLGAGSDPITLFVYGTDSPVEWVSSSGAVTVNSEGEVKRVSSGTAYITATVDGQTLKCRVLG